MTTSPARTAGGTADPEREAWAILGSADGLGPAGLIRLVQRHGSGLAVLQIAERPVGAAELVAASRGTPVGSDEADATNPRREWLDGAVASAIVKAVHNAVTFRQRLRELGLGIMTLDDADYPERLLALEHPPPILFVRGDRSALSPVRPIAVVGTRQPTEAGLRLATEIAGEITRAGGVVVSGLARGIDGAAHAEAARLRRPTVAVLGSGHGRLYPADHRTLADRIIGAGGCVVSELAPDVPGSAGTFPRRNRVISGLSDATVVVEAPRGSGSLITADWALAQGRECFLVPGSLDAQATAGSLRYLRGYHGQARIVASVSLLMEDLGFDVQERPGARPSSLHLGGTESRLAHLIVAGRRTVDELVAATGLPVSSVLSGLTLLEMRGLVAGAYGRYRPHGALVPRTEARGRRRRVRDHDDGGEP